MLSTLAAMQLLVLAQVTGPPRLITPQDASEDPAVAATAAEPTLTPVSPHGYRSARASPRSSPPSRCAERASCRDGRGGPRSARPTSSA